MTRTKVIKAPNPFADGEESRGGAEQPPPASASASSTPVTGFVVPGQPRDEARRAYGHVLTEHGWVKE